MMNHISNENHRCLEDCKWTPQEVVTMYVCYMTGLAKQRRYCSTAVNLSPATKWENRLKYSHNAIHRGTMLYFQFILRCLYVVCTLEDMNAAKIQPEYRYNNDDDDDYDDIDDDDNGKKIIFWNVLLTQLYRVMVKLSKSCSRQSEKWKKNKSTIDVKYNNCHNWSHDWINIRPYYTL